MFANDQFFDQDWVQVGLPPTLAYEGFTDQQSDSASGRHNNTYAIENTLSWYVPSWFGQHDFRFGAQFQYGEVAQENQTNLNGTFSFGRSNVPFDPANPRTYPDRFSIRVGGPLEYTQIARVHLVLCPGPLEAERAIDPQPRTPLGRRVLQRAGPYERWG